jgi:signal transduction histidine kinase
VRIARGTPMLQTDVSAAGGAPSLQFWRARILTAVVWTMAVLSTLAYATGAGAAVRVGDWAIVAFNTFAFVAIWALALLRRLPHGIRSGGVIGISYLVGLYFTARFGPFAAGPYWLFIVPMLGALLLGLRVAIGLLALVAVTLLTLGVMLAQGALPWADRLEVLRWFVISGSFLSLDGLLAICIAVLLRGLATMHAEVQREAEQRAQAERMLVHSQKADAIGRLAGGVAHDFNNALTAILSFTQFVREDLPRDAQAHEDLGEVLAAAYRAQTLTRQLLAFSRQQVVEPQRVDVNEVVTTTARMLERMLGEDIALVTRLEPSPWTVFMDPNALDQVLMNLAVNARDAMPDGGKLVIETANRPVDTDSADPEGQPMPPGDWVMVAVSDTGVGMDRDTLARIFEPFFTTKEAGKGTGLGLPSCNGVVRQAGGHLHVYSEPMHGTTFRVYLPRAEGPARSIQPPPAPVDLRGDETILVVEDDAHVRGVLIRGLRRMGYEVLEAGDGQAALAHADTHGLDIDLLVTDVIMPGTNGKELVDALRQARPDLPVLFVSGYTRDMVAHRGIVEADVDLLQKPFTQRELALRVRQILDRTCALA